MSDLKAEIASYLRTEFEMDDDDIREMMETFVESMSELREAVASQLDAGAAADLGESGHAIKGAAANVGATAISEIGRKLETAGKAGDLAACAEAAEEFSAALSEIS